MTQKELLYLEDAIKHEDNTICICEEMQDMVSEEELVDFFKKEEKIHMSIKEKIMCLMEEKLNE